MNLPNIIANLNEEYITIPSLKMFVKSKGISSKGTEAKGDYIRAISEYAGQTPENYREVSEWIDNVIKEGIKEIRILNISLDNEGELLFSNELNAQNHFNKLLSTKVPHLMGNTYSNDYDLVKVSVGKDSHGKVASFLFCRMLRYFDLKKISRGISGAIVEYPIFVDYYYEQGWLIIRYKSRSGLYDILPEKASFEEQLSHKLNVSNEVDKVFNLVRSMLHLCNTDAYSASVIMKAKFFRILDKYTHTPSEIIEVLDQNEVNLKSVVTILEQTCRLPASYHSKLEMDIKNLAEKYLSITWSDKNIFIKDREAYPTRLSATDEEESKIDQSAATIDDPLQSKEVFFDNKRMLQNQKRCEGLTLIWKRRDRTYYSDPAFPVRFSEKGGTCTLSFKKYVAEEDIQHVLFAIINA
jgi:hypothetical protein